MRPKAPALIPGRFPTRAPGEAVGIDEPTVRRAYEAAVAADDYRRACGAIRKIIAWDMIYALA